ncbi:TPA: hypothetical protein HA361_02535 [Candidatus Woesearchaeota archaeon]|nr:hypothetical protein [Candidatus Woesearchaeota archaeon]
MRERHFLTAVLMLMLLPAAYAVSITPSKIDIQFEPGYSKEFIFRTWGAEHIAIYKKGDLAEYVTLNQTSVEGKGDILVSIALPEKLDAPGKHTILIGAVETGADQGIISAAAAIQTPIYVMVPYEGYYIEASLSTADASDNESIPFEIHVRNIGTEDIKRLAASLAISALQESSESVRRETQAAELPAGESIDFHVELPAGALGPGSYRAVADIGYDAYSLTRKQEFRVGELSVELLDYPKMLYNGTINKVELVVASRWNGPIEHAYAEIDIGGSAPLIQNARTPPFSLKPWETKSIEAFIDTSSVPVGTYAMAITLYYAGKETLVRDTISIIEKQEKAGILLSPLNLALIAAVILLIIIDAVWMVARRGQPKKKTRRRR